MKRIRAIVELIALWLAITLALCVALLILLPLDTPYAQQAGHIVTGVIHERT